MYYRNNVVRRHYLAVIKLFIRTLAILQFLKSYWTHDFKLNFYKILLPSADKGDEGG